MLVCGAAVVLAAACSSGSSSPSQSTVTVASTAAASSTTSPPPTGPSATLRGPVPGTDISLTLPGTVDPKTMHYDEREWFASGTAQSYRAVGSLPDDGHFTVAPDQHAAYTTRVVTLLPHDAASFSGTVVVEWLNVTAGSDTAPDLAYMSPDLLRHGDAWIGVSVQQIGVDALRKANPQRYGALHHPGDAFAWDILSQVGRTVRTAPDLLGGLQPRVVLAVGESQSAFALTTYIDGFAPTARVFDGYLVHSRGGGAMPLAGGLAGAIAGTTKIRDDLEVPVLLLETETDEVTFGYFDARQPDTARVRLWDIAGGSHADAYLLPPGEVARLGCGSINRAPTHYAVAAALRTLDSWARTGTPPSSAPRMDIRVVGGKPTITRDANGNAEGGIRLPAIAVPTAAYSGIPPAGKGVSCIFFGSTLPFTRTQLQQLYPTHDDYISKYTTATDASIAAGYVLRDDRTAVLADATGATW
jgi:hypothetical protein